MVDKNSLKKITYQVEDKMIAELLGRQNFSTKESAILELVKNAYDSGANNLELIFENSPSGVIFTISDDGSGMDEVDIMNHWMHVGNSSREYKDEKNDRVFAGSKGIGRFALARLGKKVEMTTKKNGKGGVFWQTDWEETSYANDSSISREGTTFKIYNLNDRWNRRMVPNIADYISRVYNDDKMQIKVRFETEEKKIGLLWEGATLGENYVASISLDYNAETQQLNYTINSDEFKDTIHAIPHLESVPISKEIKTINVFDNLRNSIVELLAEDENIEEDRGDEDNKKWLDDLVVEILQGVGSFKGELFFSLTAISKKDSEKFDYKHTELNNRFKPGVVLYRNAFSIDSYEGRRDWLNLQGRAIKSPAAATHQSGRWRVRSNQLSGYIIIDKQENKNIEDLSNRQGIVEDDYFKAFKMIIEQGLDCLEFFRQRIIRKISSYKKEISKSESIQDASSIRANSLIEKIKKNPVSIQQFTADDANAIITEFNRKDAENEYIKQDKADIEHQFRYETQLLNVLATSQLRISSLAHELNNSRNSIQKTPDLLEKAIRSHLDWKMLEAEDIRETKKIPYLVKQINNNNEKILRLTDTVLEEIEKKNFESKQTNLDELFEELLKKWRSQYNWVNFNINVIDNISIEISYDYFMIIFDNLILNSIQSNDSNSLTININLSLKDNYLAIDYSDDGKGLNSKYISDPMKILEVHETSKPKGHGLGMWMVNNTIKKLNGEVTDISGCDGFNFSFNIEVMVIDE
ncbi:TPA: sensor histidine kinase [Streptococcus suis]|uniref:ATP-binding protein n=1 Tax=Streptococcus suis TaxID=1307 RepID=UPI001556CCBB|nr:sensor histidine kinase [Streptococcus suis]MBS8101532.1 sensor histidine kinase [Streptococcus suis]MCK3870380.1 sensor histidine kinase [Streptococcus suis]NQK25382.1 sensor histidine kinase [Streptococcus suis]NQL17898.1 sensor histidine kinase [Streptococcus suis]HEM4146793.1 sensor histidine kinase [Streptococcus suis]